MSLLLLILSKIRAIKLPLLIKPPLIQNSNKPPLFYPKSPLFGAFLVKFWKNFNKPPAQNLDFFIDRRRFIDADTVGSFGIQILTQTVIFHFVLLYFSPSSILIEHILLYQKPQVNT